MVNWTDANFDIETKYVTTPNYGPEQGHYQFVYRAGPDWPLHDGSYSWTYFLDNDSGIVGFVEDSPVRGSTALQAEKGADVRYYVTNGWPGNIPFSGLKEPLAEMGSVLTHDDINGGKHVDWLFPGPGNDRVRGQGDHDHIAGGSGNDLILGNDGADKLYGDWADAPIVKHEQFGNQVFKWELPKSADPAVVDGADQLNGGPRGDGWTDVLTGGGGADAFYLSYDKSGSKSEGGTFWSDFAGSYASGSSGIGGYAVQAGVENLAEDAAKEFFESLVGSVLLGGIGSAVGLAVTDALSLLFNMDKSPTPKPTGEDVMVITDFDPREDVLFMPVPAADQSDPAKTLTSNAIYFSDSATGADGQTGWGVEFSKGTSNTIFAEVFLAQDFLDAFGVTSDSPFAKSFLEDVFDNAVAIDKDGIQQPDAVYPFPTEADQYKDGVLPVVADEPIPFKAPNDTLTKVFGAFGGLSMVAPSVTSTGVYVAGTHLSDILNVNLGGFAPADAATSGNLTTETSLVRAFGGNDIVFAGNGTDDIDGGDGDDWIYGIGNTDIETSESFEGGTGDDIVYLGFTNSWAVVDGGDGTDTVSFRYLNNADGNELLVDMAKTTMTASARVSANDSTVSRYDVTNVENVTGSIQADTLTGDDEANTIDGGGGSDKLDGGGGVDTLSFASISGGVRADLATGKATSLDGATHALSYTFTGFENILGTEAADTLTGDSNDNVINGNGGADILDGGKGIDTVSFAGLTTTGSETLIIDLVDQSISGPGTDGLTYTNFEAAIGGARANNTFYGFTDASVKSELVGAQVDSVSSGAGTDTVITILQDDFYPNAAAETLRSSAGLVAVSYASSPEGVSIDLTKPGPYSGGWAEGDVFDFDERSVEIQGSAFADRLAGNGGVLLDGGAGADVYGIGLGSNVVRNFVSGEDRIDVSSLGITSMDELTIEALAGVVVSVGAGTSLIEFDGNPLPVSSVAADDFIFAPAVPGLFVAGHDATTIELTGRDAAFNNALGVFEIAGDGTVGEVDIAIPASKEAPIGSTIVLDGIQAGDRFGFFIVQDESLAGLDGSFALRHEANGEALTLTDLLADELQAELVFIDGAGEERTINAEIFTSVDRGDGNEQARTTPDGDGGHRLAFEDLDVTGYSDSDFNDLEILISSTPTESA